MTTACRTANADLLADFTAKNNEALQTLINKHGVVLRELPKEVLKELETISEDMLQEQAETELDQRILKSFVEFKEQAKEWHRVSELSYYQSRR